MIYSIASVKVLPEPADALYTSNSTLMYDLWCMIYDVWFMIYTKKALYLLCKENTKPFIMQLISLMIYDFTFFCLAVKIIDVIINIGFKQKNESISVLFRGFIF